MAPDRRYTRNYCNVKIVDKRDALFSWSTTLAAVIARNNQISFVADRREIVHHNGTGCAPLLNRNSLRPGYNRKYLPRTGHGCEIVFTSRIGISFGRCYSRGGKERGERNFPSFVYLWISTRVLIEPNKAIRPINIELSSFRTRIQIFFVQILSIIGRTNCRQ